MVDNIYQVGLPLKLDSPQNTSHTGLESGKIRDIAAARFAANFRFEPLAPEPGRVRLEAAAL
jgi:hypothetical protein